MNPYSYTYLEPHFATKLNKTTRNWSRYTVEFPVAKPTGYKENNIAYGEYYEPAQGSKFPLTILVHGWGDRSLLPCKILAKDLAKKGIACFIIYLVFHPKRMPAAVIARLPNLTPEEWFEGYQTSVIDIRQVIDWAGCKEEIDESRIAVIGISLGGIISTITMGVDKRINAGVIIVAGGNYQSPAWLKMTEPGRNEEEYIRAQNIYDRYLREVEKKGIDNVVPANKSYLTDPMTFANDVRGRPLLMLNAKWDERIPKQSTLDLWQAADKPQIKWYPTSHASIWLLYPSLLKQITDFLSSAFKC